MVSERGMEINIFPLLSFISVQTPENTIKICIYAMLISLKYLKSCVYFVQGDQKVSVHQTITVHKSGAQRLFDHPVQHRVSHTKIIRSATHCVNMFGIVLRTNSDYFPIQH
jgi:hypothetical protein